MDNKRKMLILVEGQKTDKALMKKLLELYNIDMRREIVSYNTNIYTLYNDMFYNGKPGNMDVLEILYEREADIDRKPIFRQMFTHILLIFDLDPQDSQFSSDKITGMLNYFTESTDMGKLYINYPMIEAFYHLKSIPDREYKDRFATLDELKNKKYKERVNKENRNRDYSKFAVNRKECNIVIKQNIEKGQYISRENEINIVPDGGKILKNQLETLKTRETLYVLCTCVYFIPEYNPNLLELS
jgi:hypothetical protein